MSTVNLHNIDRVIERLCQARTLDFGDVSDASSITRDPGGWDSPDGYLQAVHAWYGRDQRTGQPVVAEVITEARERSA